MTIVFRLTASFTEPTPCLGDMCLGDMLMMKESASSAGRYLPAAAVTDHYYSRCDSRLPLLAWSKGLWILTIRD
jgi:hypothetical protein